MKLTKEKIYGISGSILSCIVLLLILYFTFLRTEIKAKEEGILVNFGAVDLAAGTFKPESEVAEAARQEAAPTSPDEEIPEVPLTQNLEQTAAIEAAKQKEKEKAAAEQAAKAEQARLAEEQRKRDSINRQVSGAFGPSNTEQSDQPSNPQNATTTTQSAGSYGEFNLGGRTLSAGGLPRPAYSAQEEGNIVIDITVDPRGNVILAEIGKGTTINSTAMRRSALDAARKAKFSSITGNNNQSGTITFRYNLK